MTVVTVATSSCGCEGVTVVTVRSIEYSTLGKTSQLRKSNTERLDNAPLCDGVAHISCELFGLLPMCPQPRHDLKRPWDAVTKRAGLVGVRLHDLRHTYASFGAGGGLACRSSDACWVARRRRPPHAMPTSITIRCGARQRLLQGALPLLWKETSSKCLAASWIRLVA